MTDTSFYQAATDDHAAMLADVFDLPVDLSPAAEESTPSTTEAAAPAGEGVVAPSPSPEPPAAPPAPVAQPSSPPSPAAAPAPTPAPVAPAPPPAGPTQAQYDDLVRQITELKSAQAAPTSPAGTAPTAPAAAPEQPLAERAIDYNTLSLPDNVVEAIFAEDPKQAKAGLDALVRGVLTAAHTQFRAEMGDTLTRFGAARDQARATQTAEQTQIEQARTMQEQFYGKFPALNNPVAKTIVATVNQQLLQENPSASWDDNYIASLGARAQAEIRRLAGLPVEEPTPAAPPAPTPAPKPAAFAPAGNRAPGSTAATPSLAEEVSDLFSDG